MNSKGLDPGRNFPYVPSVSFWEVLSFQWLLSLLLRGFLQQCQGLASWGNPMKALRYVTPKGTFPPSRTGALTFRDHPPTPPPLPTSGPTVVRPLRDFSLLFPHQPGTPLRGLWALLLPQESPRAIGTKKLGVYLITAVSCG